MWTRQVFREIAEPPAIGMIHLQALPGSPGWGGDLKPVLDAAVADAKVLAEAGFTALMVENYHDVPFCPDRVPPETIAALTRAVVTLASGFPHVKWGVNVLRNDADAALGIAAATGAAFIRVNVHVGAAVTDQGPLTGRAWHTLRRRRELGCPVGILADVRVKHARPLVERPLAEEAADLRLRGLADAVIVTGAATGAAVDAEDLAVVREALPDCPLLVGSGVTAATVGELLAVADGCIVGSCLQETKPDAGRRVVPERATEFLAALAKSVVKGPST